MRYFPFLMRMCYGVRKRCGTNHHNHLERGMTNLFLSSLFIVFLIDAMFALTEGLFVARHYCSALSRLTSRLLDKDSKQALIDSHPLVAHMSQVSKSLAQYNFLWLQQTDTNWASQTAIPTLRRKAMMACLFHFNLDVSLVMRFLGGNYTAAHRNYQTVATNLLDMGLPKYLVT